MNVAADVCGGRRGRSLNGCLGAWVHVHVARKNSGAGDRGRAAGGVETGVLEGLVYVLDRLGLFDPGHCRRERDRTRRTAGDCNREGQERGSAGHWLLLLLLSLLTSGRGLWASPGVIWFVANVGTGVLLSLFREYYITACGRLGRRRTG